MSHTKRERLSVSPQSFYNTSQTKSNWHDRCIKAGLNETLWNEFDYHDFKSLKALYENRDTYTTVFARVFDTINLKNLNIEKNWDSINNTVVGHTLYKSLKAAQEDDSRDFKFVESHCDGFYKLKIKISDFHKSIGDKKIMQEYCVVTCALPKESVMSFIDQNGKEHVNPFFKDETLTVQKTL